MPVPYINCKKHSWQEAIIHSKCSVCASEEKESAPLASTNIAIVQFLERVVSCLDSSIDIVAGSPLHDTARELLQKQHQ